MVNDASAAHAAADTPDGGPGSLVRYQAWVSCALGDILLTSDGEALTGLYFSGQPDCPALADRPGAGPVAVAARKRPSDGMLQGRPLRTVRWPPAALALPGLWQPAMAGEACGAPQCLTDTPAQTVRLFDRVGEALAGYFLGQRRVFDLPLRHAGTPFQQAVWQALHDIPYGQCLSYGALADRLGFKGGHARAVGAAVGRNPISIVIPCHRVIAASGTLTGYTGGLARKLALLSLERESGPGSAGAF